MEELAEIRKRTDLEIEAFVHGAMCISYSGRCTLSNHMSDRDANRGGCSQSCRWKYDLYDMPFGQERKSIHGEVPEEYSMSAVDMCMIENIPDLIDNGVDSLKIEGRMKSVHYVSTVANCYKAACDAYMESAEAFYAIKDDLMSFGKLPNVNWQLVSTTRHQQKTSNSLVPVVKFHNTNLLVKSLTLTQQL